MIPELVRRWKEGTRWSTLSAPLSARGDLVQTCDGGPLLSHHPEANQCDHPNGGGDFRLLDRKALTYLKAMRGTTGCGER